MSFKVLVHAVLLFGSDTWMLTPHMEQALGDFKHRVARWITGRQPRRREEGGWEYPPLAAAMEEAGFEEMGVYIIKRQNMDAQYIATRPILNLYKRSVWRPVAWVSQSWW